MRTRGAVSGIYPLHSSRGLIESYVGIVYDHKGARMGFQVSSVDHEFVVPVFGSLMSREHHTPTHAIQSVLSLEMKMYKWGSGWIKEADNRTYMVSS